jgi:single-stranded-DNA-specific exonuclease
MEKTIVRRPRSVINFNLPTLHPILQRIYASRGILSANELEQELKNLYPYNLLMGIPEAMSCLFEAITAQQHIVVIGDFDADGATSTAVAVAVLKALGVRNVSYLVPNRFQYGYGLTPKIVEVAAARDPKLIITVDNGISSVDGVKKAAELGIKVLITDHHLPGLELPIAAAIVNPNQHHDAFPSKNLAGVGVIFYVLLALRSYLREHNWFQLQGIAEPNMGDFLDLVALGTVADVVQLDQNNRILVNQGIKRIRQGKARPGIQALLQIANRHPANISAADLGFAVAPRLNAAGRLEDMSLGIECLLAEDHAQAMVLATRLDQLNKERREIEETMHQHALELLNTPITQNAMPMGLCLHDASWHQGVIGILASRVKEQVHRPVIAFATINADEMKGSGRSIAGLHIRDVLERIAVRFPELIQRFGGHAMAAGLSIHPNNFDKFSTLFAEEVSKELAAEDLQAKIRSDGELECQDLNLHLAEMLREAGPWGQGFPEPLFDNEFTILEQRLVGGKHLKLVLKLANSSFEAIAFNVNTQIWPSLGLQKIRAAYRLDINEYRGQRRLQLLIEHLEPSII